MRKVTGKSQALATGHLQNQSVSVRGLPPKIVPVRNWSIFATTDQAGVTRTMGRMHVYQPCSFMTCWHARALWALVSVGVDGFVTRSAHRRGVQVYTNLLVEDPRMVTRACRRIDFAWTKSARATFAWQTRNSRVVDFPGRYSLSRDGCLSAWSKLCR